MIITLESGRTTLIKKLILKGADLRLTFDPSGQKVLGGFKELKV